VAHRTLAQLFADVRQYLDTDALNFPDALLDTLLRKVWFQAVSMEREWRFFQRSGTADVTAGQALVPFTFDTVPTPAMPAVRLLVVKWGDEDLIWRELSMMLRDFDEDNRGQPCYYSEQNDGTQRNIALFPTPIADGTVTVEFYAEPVYPVGVPVDYTGTFSDLPFEFDDALQEGLLAEMYMREEDPDLYQVHRQMFLEQMGSIRNHWRESTYTPLVYGGRARGPGGDPGGWHWGGYVTRPAAG
jgi:hypothetical protein